MKILEFHHSRQDGWMPHFKFEGGVIPSDRLWDFQEKLLEKKPNHIARKQLKTKENGTAKPEQERKQE